MDDIYQSTLCRKLNYPHPREYRIKECAFL